jgi:hypothetical protein
VQDQTIQLDFSVSNYFLNFHLADEHLRFTASTGRGPGITALYDLDLQTGELIKLSSDIDQRFIALYWSPSGKHALYGYTGEYGSWGYPVFLDDLNGDTAIEVSDIFGSSSCCWHWYEE